MTLRAGSGGMIVAGQRLAAGGQGEVLAVSSPRGVVFKRYLPKALNSDPALERRLGVMVDHPPEWRERGSGHVTLAWPTDRVFDSRRFAGFLMPMVDMGNTVGLHRVTNPSDRRTSTGATAWTQGFSWRYLVRTGVNLSQVTDVLHQAGVVIGDFNESNVRVSREARVTLLDCDSMQISDPVSGERFFCPVGRLEFTPPELLRADWKKTLRHPSSDLFALAIHLYQLLLEGEHPFRGIWSGSGDKPSVSDLAKDGLWAHKKRGKLSPRPSAIAISLLPGDIVDLFRKAFEDGATNPDARPAAHQWQKALGQLEKHLRTCKVNPAHVYPSFHKADCPWCKRAQGSTGSHGSSPSQKPLPTAPVTAPSPVTAFNVVTQPSFAPPKRPPGRSQPKSGASRGREVSGGKLDKTASLTALILAVTVVVPVALGIWVWQRYLMSVASAPPPNLRAVPGGALVGKYAPEYLFGVLALVGLLGLVLVRPPWTSGRASTALAGVLLIAVGGASQWAANTAANHLYAAGWSTYDRGPIPVSALGRTCGESWTNATRVHGSFPSWVLMRARQPGHCATVAEYLGWRQVWAVSASGYQSYIGLGAYKNGVLVTVRESGTRVGLIGLDEVNGAALWHWRCPGGRTMTSVSFLGADNGRLRPTGRASVKVKCRSRQGRNKVYYVTPHRTLRVRSNK